MLTQNRLLYSGGCSPDDTKELVDRMQEIIHFYEFVHEDNHSLLISKAAEKIRISSFPHATNGDISGIKYAGKREDLERTLKVIEMDGFPKYVQITLKSPTEEIELNLNHPKAYNSDSYKLGKILKLSPGLPLLNAGAEQDKELLVTLYSPEFSGNTFYCSCLTRIQFAGDEFFSK